ncbi:TetR/AcrR family transcriptional regulator [Bdellovibrio bacteriovorus]|uniref:TetR/AcrR family transcriptional regulator n=1 Tax=Bdellovibrio bacteriovorus TaxID=959 RepID=UPI0021D2B6A6|nr:TetR/AcrR family transcriptional regulator [Bdellovibrio bacteriovorus]UXR65940.1 TetR/AcrR family transcriptional regulator [Bdellovibrio bacteriovorus]
MEKGKKAPKKTRNLEQSRKEILDAAFWEVFTRGFQGVSIDDIVKKTSMTKGAFYHQFPTKLDLGYALVDEVIKPMTYSRWIDPLKEYDNPLEGILLQIKKLIGKAAPQELRYGCPLNNLVQEMAPVDAGFKKRLQNALTYWIEGMDKELKRAQKEGFLRPDVNTRQVAHFVVMAHEGFYGMLKGLDDPKAFNALYDSLKRYFETLRA